MILERARALAPLRSFNSDVFRESEQAPQELCNLILAFAVVFNDCRDLALWSDDLLRARPEESRFNRYQGEHGGQTFHVIRLACGTIHELGELIRKHGGVLNQSLFLGVLNRLPEREKGMWNAVRDLAFGKKSAKSADDLLEDLRNTTAFHYDAPELAVAYDERFPKGSTDRGQQPLLSLGSRVDTARFYFGDAAVTALVSQQIERHEVSEFGKRFSEILKNVSVALALIVEGFIEAKSALRDFAEDPAPARAVDNLSIAAERDDEE
jgi:hypothetical protein